MRSRVDYSENEEDNPVLLNENYSFTLPHDFSDVDSRAIDLSGCSLHGETCYCLSLAMLIRCYDSLGGIPESLGSLTNLIQLRLSSNSLSGAYGKKK